MKIFRILALSMILLTGIITQAQNDTMTAHKIIHHTIDAMGGMDYLKNIKTLYSDISTMMDGRQVHWIVKEMAPNKGSFQIDYQNRTVFKSWFDGKTAFETLNGKNKDADQDGYKDKLFKKNIFNEIDYLDSTLWKLEYLGVERVNNTPCYKIKGTLASGLVMLLYFDQASYLMVRSDKNENPESSRFTTIFYSNYKTFDKLVYPTEFKYGDDKTFQHGTLVDLRINKSVDEKDFE